MSFKHGERVAHTLVRTPLTDNGNESKRKTPYFYPPSHDNRSRRQPNIILNDDILFGEIPRDTSVTHCCYVARGEDTHRCDDQSRDCCRLPGQTLPGV